MNGYRIAVCQFAPRLFDKDANLQSIAELAGAAARGGARLALFPECCVTGYAVGELTPRMGEGAESVVGPSPGPAVRRLARLSDGLGMQLLVGMPEECDGRIFNTAVAIAPGVGVVGVSRKVQLWGDDKVVFTAGDRFDVLPAPAGAGTYGPLVCFDVEFPEAARSVALLGAALVATISANPKAWADQQRIFAQARAAENQVYVAIANCIGTAGDVAFAGRSIITDPLGNVLAETGENEAVLFADVDVDEIPRVRGAEGGYLGLRRPETYLTA